MTNEIEIKAHVENLEQTLEVLKRFAKYEFSILRKDKYFCLPNTPKKLIRIREQIINNTEKSYIITYKNKNFHTDKNGGQIEFNQEFETTIEDGKILENYFLSTGFIIDVEKTKQIHEFTYTFTNNQISKEPITANLELCTISPIGDFLEIEILSDSQDENVINQIHNELYNILEKADISKDKIENKTYSSMIKEFNNKHI